MVSEENKSLVFNVNDVLNERYSSVKLTRNTRGVVWEIKVYNSDANKAMDIANNLFEKCKQKYEENEKWV